MVLIVCFTMAIIFSPLRSQVCQLCNMQGRNRVYKGVRAIFGHLTMQWLLLCCCLHSLARIADWQSQGSGDETEVFAVTSIVLDSSANSVGAICTNVPPIVQHQYLGFVSSNQQFCILLRAQQQCLHIGCKVELFIHKLFHVLCTQYRACRMACISSHNQCSSFPTLFKESM